MTDPALAQVRTYLERRGVDPARATVRPLAGDASDRRYYRVEAPGRSSRILAVHRDPFDIDTLPFANVSRLFQAVPVPIPDIVGHAGDLGILELEDLGDVTLQQHVARHPPDDVLTLYRTAVDLIAALQARTDDLRSERFLPFGLAFDEEKLAWELDFFLTYFVEGHRGLPVSAAARRNLRTAWTPLVDTLASERRVVCHRDYHSRNLMVQGERLYVIDFQDARLGPDTYDLVSLVRDAYIDLSPIQTTNLVEYFLDLTGRQDPTSAARFRERLDVMGVQRHLKALGTFGFQASVRQRHDYLECVPRTLGYLRDELLRQPWLAPLRQALEPFVVELRG